MDHNITEYRLDRIQREIRKKVEQRPKLAWDASDMIAAIFEDALKEDASKWFEQVYEGLLPRCSRSKDSASQWWPRLRSFIHEDGYLRSHLYDAYELGPKELRLLQEHYSGLQKAVQVRARVQAVNRIVEKLEKEWELRVLGDGDSAEAEARRLAAFSRWQSAMAAKYGREWERRLTREDLIDGGFQAANTEDDFNEAPKRPAPPTEPTGPQMCSVPAPCVPAVTSTPAPPEASPLTPASDSQRPQAEAPVKKNARNAGQKPKNDEQSRWILNQQRLNGGVLSQEILDEASRRWNVHKEPESWERQLQRYRKSHPETNDDTRPTPTELISPPLPPRQN